MLQHHQYKPRENTQSQDPPQKWFRQESWLRQGRSPDTEPTKGLCSDFVSMVSRWGSSLVWAHLWAGSRAPHGLPHHGYLFSSEWVAWEFSRWQLSRLPRSWDASFHPWREVRWEIEWPRPLKAGEKRAGGGTGLCVWYLWWSCSLPKGLAGWQGSWMGKAGHRWHGWGGEVKQWHPRPATKGASFLRVQKVPGRRNEGEVERKKKLLKVMEMSAHQQRRELLGRHPGSLGHYF